MTSDAPTTRARLSEAFRKAYEQAGLSQEALSELTGVKQTTISKYARGAVQPPLEYLPAVDAACRQPRGHVLRLAGLVDDAVDVVAAIENDPTLPDLIDREALIGLYEVFRRRSAD
jgi:transcriptional regulator with XRE-family HTH domain